jgi:two-component system nitrate/nitrite response regulator NarL
MEINMTDAFPTCLIEKNALLREGLKRLLAETDFKIMAAYPDINSIEPNPDIALVIIGMENDCCDPPETLKNLKSAFPRGHVVILTGQTSPDYMASSYAAGIDGYILRDVSPSAMLGTLEMVRSGQKSYPAALFTAYMHSKSERPGRQEKAHGASLSDRESQILNRLANGETNKQIAIVLDITEATVKVHVKTILRKLHLANRTQAAIWAISKGLTNHERGHWVA